MRKSPCALLLTLPALAFVLGGACGKLKPADTSGAAGSTGAAGTGVAGSGAAGTGAGGTTGKVLVTVSGAAAPHPLNDALMASADFSMLKVAIADPAATIVDPNAAPLGSMALDTSTGNCDATLGCKWSLSGIDITHQTLGLVGTLEDTRTGDARLWVKTGTGMGTAADVAAVIAAPAPITMRRAFIVSRKLEATLGKFVGTVLNQTFNPGDLEVRGFLIGHVVDKLSSAPMPAGVAGATVAATGDFDVIYPNADFSGKGAATAASGIFLMVPHTAMPVVTMWDVVPPTGDTRTWTKHLAGANPNNAFIIIMPADE
jgi:hypothetical protein